MALKNVEYWVVAQLVLDVGLFLLVLFFVCKTRSLGRRLHAAQNNGANYDEKIVGLSQQIVDLADRLEIWESHTRSSASPAPQLLNRDVGSKRTPSFFPEADPNKSLRSQVEELASRGIPSEEIAHRLGLQLAEVNVALDLSRLLGKREAGPF